MDERTNAKLRALVPASQTTAGSFSTHAPAAMG